MLALRQLQNPSAWATVGRQLPQKLQVCFYVMLKKVKSISLQAIRLKATSSQTVDHLGTYDDSYDEMKIPKGDPAKREFTYLALGKTVFTLEGFKLM